jgi:hypothetical protein
MHAFDIIAIVGGISMVAIFLTMVLKQKKS